MRAPFVKVCGITRLEDAVPAVEAGARAIGFVLVPESPRHVSVAAAARISAALPEGVARVGVVVNLPPPVVAHLVAAIGLTAIQAHGEETPDTCRAYGLPVVKAFAPGPEAAVEDLEPFRGFPILIDAVDPGFRGGSGRTADWGFARRAVERGFRILLAGGLGPETVAAACRAVEPVAVDLNSRVEVRPGIKDIARIQGALRTLDAMGMDPPEETAWPW